MDKSEATPLIVIVGPTASGKTSFATNLAAKVGGEILSGDSRQVFRGMDIGTGKDLEDYTIEGKAIPYHLIDIRDAGQKYNASEFYNDFFEALEKVKDREAVPILCGGSGMYIEYVLTENDLTWVPRDEELRRELKELSVEELVKRLQGLTDQDIKDPNNRRRLVRAVEIADYLAKNPGADVSGNEKPELKPIIFGLDIDREARRERISKRLRDRLEEGMVEEVRGLLDSGVTADELIFYGLEYRWVTLYVLGEIGFEEMTEKLERNIHQFAKRQMTWFRGMERRGFDIHWINALDSMDSKISQAMEILDKNGFRIR
ncbi:tRNA dimethylallyltransferase 2 (plasmid) [Fulvitalea axinellae]|uniref:tRNA dimethylallyltransferase n=1 Tax=Fulvitalea axinellae TaxID=1182444 RepID=A0AAU9D846_9BACT|nr:tRNA dimethylallyltransferase 2 [Fulvitalea axinellae]